MRRLHVMGLLGACVMAGGCGESEKGTPPPWANGGTSTAPAAAAPAAAPAPAAQPAQAAAPGQAGAPAAAAAPAAEDPARSKLLAQLRERKWTNEDFIESETNRDPFHPFLVDIGQGELPTPQYEILMAKYSLDEVKLSMVVGPPESRGGVRTSAVAPRAMFVDPTGMGHAVVRGNHISKADATVFRIDSDKGQVSVKLREELGNGKSREVERVLELHQGGEANP